MASRTAALLITAAMSVVVMSALLLATTSAEVYEVGEGDGWDLGVDYNDWASGQTFNVGDMLKFEYSTEQPYPHNVVLVDQASFEACTVPTNAFTLTSGDDTVPLYSAGQYFFISGINSDCKSGMKLAINVAQ